jgi:hypothetical protein
MTRSDRYGVMLLQLYQLMGLRSPKKPYKTIITVN